MALHWHNPCRRKNNSGDDVSEIWAPPKLSDLPSWEGAKRVAIDCETRDPTLKKFGPGAGRFPNSYITGVSFAIEDGPCGYLPIRHEEGGNLDEEGVLNYLREQAKYFKGDIAGANLQYDLDYLAGEGVEFKSKRFFRDIQVAAPLLNELHFSYSMDSIAERLGIEGKDETKLNKIAEERGLNPKSDMWKLHSQYVGEYAEQDARLPLEILRKQERQIEQQDLWNIYDLESKVLPVLVKMRRRGVRIHTGRLEKIEEWAIKAAEESLELVRHETGINIAVADIMKAKALVPALEYLGVKIKRTPTGKPKVDTDAFDSIDHPVAQALKYARKVAKLKTTFAQSVRNHMINGRLHCTFNQLKREANSGDGTSGAAYGRLSCQNPNLQQQPARDAFAQMWRSIYLPEEGQLWAANDYSQQEPRMAIHYACLSQEVIGTEAWNAAIAARDLYRKDPNADSHQMMADFAKTERDAAKAIFLGLCYGMGGPKMCESLGLKTMISVKNRRGYMIGVDTPEGQRLAEGGARRWRVAGVEGQAIIDKFNAAVPFVKKMARACDKKAAATGHIKTIAGRRCRFPQDAEGNFNWTNKGFNRLIQGSSADQTKMAMVACDDAGFDLIIQVHDEIAFGVQNPEEAEAAAEIMRNCTPLQLPSKVDVELGTSWGHSKGDDKKGRELFNLVKDL